jgi:tetratricopeptide (TPR) repeat protein
MQNMINYLLSKYYQKHGQKLLTKGHPLRAENCFRKALMRSGAVEDRFNLGLALMSSQKYEEAAKFLEKVYAEYPENMLNILSLAECFLMLSKWQKAVELYQELLQQQPQNKTFQKYHKISEDPVAREKYVKSKKLLNSAILDLDKKKDKVALQKLLEAEKYYPDNPTIIFNIGSVYILLKEYEKAYKYLEKAISLAPNSKKFHKNFEFVKKKLRK